MLRAVCKLFVYLILGTLFTFLTFAASSVPQEVLDATTSVYRVLAEYEDGYSLGSGFIISKDEKGVYLATNNHVISEKPLNIYIIDESGNEINAAVFVVDYKKDLAILKVPNHFSGEPLVLNEIGVKKGDAVYAVGFPGAADYIGTEMAYQSIDATITDGIASSIRKGKTIEGANVDMIQISAAINSGNSGGPLFNEKGEVIGVNTYSAEDSQSIYWAIAIKEIFALMQSKNLSIVIPIASPTEDEKNLYAENSYNIPTFLLIVLATILLIFMLVLLIKRQKNKFVLCAECGAKVLKKSKFCKKCGKNLQAIQLNSPKIEKPPHVRFCKKCGKELLNNTMFCKHCGERIYYYTGDEK